MSGLLAVEVVYGAGPGQTDRVGLLVDTGATVADAVQASGLLQRHALNAATLETGIWSRLCAPDTVLRMSDRVEIYRPLQVDPKEARRLRYQQSSEQRGRPRTAKT